MGGFVKPFLHIFSFPVGLVFIFGGFVTFYQFGSIFLAILLKWRIETAENRESPPPFVGSGKVCQSRA
jgi:hypothetical protein